MNTFILIGILILILFFVLVLNYVRRKTGIDINQVDFIDADGRGKVIYSDRLGICGKPDYIIREGKHLIPVELKPSASRIYDAHLAQIFTYCLLLEDKLGKQIPYGIIQNKVETKKIPFTDKQRAYVKGLIRTLKVNYEQEFDRSHKSARLCASCRYNQICDQALR